MISTSVGGINDMVLQCVEGLLLSTPPPLSALPETLASALQAHRAPSEIDPDGSLLTTTQVDTVMKEMLSFPCCRQFVVYMLALILSPQAR